MLQQWEVQEEEEAHQESPNDVLEGAAERPLVCDTQEEFYPLPTEIQEENLECIANELQKQDEQEEEEALQFSRNDAVEEDEDEPLVSCSQEEFWPSPREEHKEHLEVIVNVVASIYSLDSDGQVTVSPQTPSPESPEGGFFEQESCYLTDNEDLLQDSSASLGYYPCYHTYGQLPPCQPEGGDDLPKHPGSTDASIQVGGTFQDKASEWERGEEANPGEEETKRKPHPDKWSLPPSPEEALGINSEGPAVPKEGEQKPPAPSCPPAPSTSRRSVNHLLQWVRNIFSRTSLPRPPPSPAPVGGRRHGRLGTRLRGWIMKHRGRVHPHPC